MNIFYLDSDPKLAAQMMHDKHVVKMILESAQMLSTVVRSKIGDQEGIYGSTHAGHPCVIWATQTDLNYLWLVEHGWALCDEYQFRYGKTHASKVVIDRCSELYYKMSFPTAVMTPPAQAMPEQYKVPGDAVQAYRNYYLGEKVHQSRWTRRPVPDIFKEAFEMAKKTPKDAPETAQAAPATVTTEAPKAPKLTHNKKLVVVGDIKDECAIKWEITANPRMPGRATFDRFATYFGAATVGEYKAKGGTQGDLLWDLRSGYLNIEGVSLSTDVSLRKPKGFQKKAEAAPAATSEAAAAVNAQAAEEKID